MEGVACPPRVGVVGMRAVDVGVRTVKVGEVGADIIIISSTSWRLSVSVSGLLLPIIINILNKAPKLLNEGLCHNNSTPHWHHALQTSNAGERLTGDSRRKIWRSIS